MCGFAGILRFDNSPVSQKTLERMGGILFHRGPDDAGIETLSTRPGSQVKNLGMAFRRLAIIDLSATGHQPMYSDDRRIAIVYNGEVYNAPELRRALEAEGQIFRGTSDTEVILRLYEKKGGVAFAELNGMFAIALWDGRNHKLHLVRDRIGIKPLYYAVAGETLLFASEIKALFCHESIKRSFNPVGVVDYMSFQFCLGEETIFKDVRLLPPATIQTYDLTKPQAMPTVQRFWSWQRRPDHRRSLVSFAEELRLRLEAALKRQVRSDVPVGTFLSSGMDTGAISVLAVRHLPHMHSFTCGFDTTGMEGEETLYDERRDAQALADRLGTKHHTLTLGPSALRDGLRATAWHMESPQVGISYQILAMAGVIRDHTSVVLSGTGGDELFAGYHWRYQPLMNLAKPEALDTALYRQWCRLLDDESRWQVLSDRLRPDAGDPRQRFDAAMADCDSDEPLSRMLYFELHGFLHGLLQLDDKLNMAHSVEARVPLLDNDMLDLAQSIPSAMKYDGTNTKIVLKQALRGILPDEVINRRKQGFTPPDASTMRTLHRPWLEEILRSSRFEAMGLVKKEAVSRILEEHISGVRNHRFLLWAFLCLHGAQELYIEDSDNRFTGA